MMLNSENINEIAAALAKAQSTMKIPEKDKTNPHFKNKYASLGSILTACKTALNTNGISVSQQMSECGGKPVLVSSLMHSSGQWIRSYMFIRLAESATAQQMGSFLTYAKRYSLCALLGVDADEDDDGELASTPAPQKKEVLKEEAPVLHLTQKQVDILKSKTHPDRFVEIEAKCKKVFKTSDLRALTLEAYETLLKEAEDKLKAEMEDEG